MGKLLSALIVEFVGTFALTFVGVCAIVLTASHPDSGANLLTVALAHGLILSVIVTAGMHISGAAYNPAVTIALLTTGHCGVKKAAGYIVAQCAGAVAAAAIVNWALSPLTTPDGNAAIDVTNLGATMGSMKEVMPIFILEAVATFFLMFAIIGSAVDSRGTGSGAKVGGFAIGLTVAANILAIGPLTGASMNPARTLGPMVFEGGARASFAWVYFVAPVVGAVIAAQIWKNFLRLPAPGKSDE